LPHHDVVDLDVDDLEFVDVEFVDADVVDVDVVDVEFAAVRARADLRSSSDTASPRRRAARCDAEPESAPFPVAGAFIGGSGSRIVSPNM
jgi:hypothetical protein